MNRPDRGVEPGPGYRRCEESADRLYWTGQTGLRDRLDDSIREGFFRIVGLLPESMMGSDLGSGKPDF
jgi:hypothetical protein